MPTKSRRAPKRKQPSGNRSLYKVGDELRKKAAKKLAKEYAARRAALDKEYKKRLKALQSSGIYAPKSQKLTKSRRRTINKRFREFEEFITGDYYVFVPFPTKNKSKRRAASKLAKQNEMNATRKGVFIQKTKDTVSAKMIYDHKSKSYRVEVKRKKIGATGEKDITEIIPIEPMGALDDEIARITSDAQALGPLGKKESIAFKVISNGEEGYSHKIFGTVAELKNYLNARYGSNIAFKVGFFRTLTVVKTHNGSWFRDHPIKARNPYAGRSRNSAARILRPGRR